MTPAELLELATVTRQAATSARGLRVVDERIGPGRRAREAAPWEVLRAGELAAHVAGVRLEHRARLELARAASIGTARIVYDVHGAELVAVDADTVRALARAPRLPRAGVVRLVGAELLEVLPCPVSGAWVPRRARLVLEVSR